MGKRWLVAVGWVVVWLGVHVLVRSWGMWWAFGTAGALTVAGWILLRRTCAVLFASRLPVASGSPRIIRRVILEEEVSR